MYYFCNQKWKEPIQNYMLKKIHVTAVNFQHDHLRHSANSLANGTVENYLFQASI